MAKKKTIEELRTLDAQCSNLFGSLGAVVGNLDIISEIGATRELSMVKTKIDEAMMWLERYQSEVCIELANRTCR